jgi:hypothetical protein
MSGEVKLSRLRARRLLRVKHHRSTTVSFPWIALTVDYFAKQRRSQAVSSGPVRGESGEGMDMDAMNRSSARGYEWGGG